MEKLLAADQHFTYTNLRICGEQTVLLKQNICIT